METVLASALHPQAALFYSLVTITTILLAIYLYIENLRAVRLGNKIPGPKALPIVGHALLTSGVHPNKIVEMGFEYDKYGPVVRGFLGPKLFVFLYHPRDVEIILSSPVHIDKSAEYRYFKPWLGDGLLISSGEKWKTHRKIIAPTFHLSILKTFVPFFYQNSKDLVVRLRNKIGKEFDCHDYLSEVTVDILVDTVMGLKGTQKNKSGYEYAMAVMKMCDILHRRHYNVNLRSDFLFQFSKESKEQKRLLNIIHDLTATVITKKAELVDQKSDSNVGEEQKTTNVKEENESEARMHYVRDDLDDLDENDVGQKKRLAFLDLLLDLSKNSGKLTDEEVAEEVNTLMFEGHDTTAAGSSFALCILGIHQDIQDRVYEELDGIFEGSDRPCTFQDTLQMKYLERVIMETLRLCPPVPAIARELNEDVTLVTGNYVLPKGCTVLIALYKIHHLEEFYPDPEKFNPDNFLPENMQKRHYYAYIPFSAGPRSCVGRKYAMLKLKVLLSTILRNYKILSDVAEKDFKLRADIILKRADGFRIRIEPRDKSSQETGVSIRFS